MALTDEGIINVPGLASRWARLANGARAHYVTAGDSGPAIVLLHGGIVGSSGTAGWRFMAPYLAANGFRVYCPDRPSYGLADTREEYWPVHGLWSMVDFVEQFADALCLDEFHIGGNSQGCSSAVFYTTNHPERVMSMGLIAGSFGNVVDPDKRVRGTMDMSLLNSFDGTPASMKAMMEPIIYRKVAIDDELLDMRTRSATAQKDSTAAFRKGMELGVTDPNLKQLLTTKGRFDQLTIPGIYLHGMDDVLSPVENGYLQEDAMDAAGNRTVQFFYPEECGHQGQTDQPEMFNEVFLEFFRDGKVSRKTADWAGISTRRAENPDLIEQAAATPAG